ncbi:MAG: HDIG domain-containing protein [Muribaculaceae bacterium]|nr:HDIG domain-containing protein [Muribaculaceae bacterium]
MGNGKFSKIIWQSLFFVIAVSLTIAFIPREKQFRYHFEEGKPWRYGLLTAPFDFPVYKSDQELTNEYNAATKSFIPFFVTDKERETNEIADFRANNTSNDPDTSLLYKEVERLLKMVYKQGIVDLKIYEELKSEQKDIIRIKNGSIASEYSTTNLLTPRMAYELMIRNSHSAELKDIISHKNLNLYIEPNLLYDTATNKKTLDQILQNIQPTAGMVQKGERIIDRGVIVTHDLYRILNSYEKKSLKTESEFDKSTYILAGKILMVIIIYTFLYLFLILFRKRIFNNIRQLSLLMLMILLITISSYLLSQRWLLGIYMAPFAVLPIIIVTFMDTRIALYASLVAIMLSCWASPFPTEYIFLQLIVSMTTINSLKELTKRSQMFRSVVLVFIAYCITYTGYMLMTEGDFSKLNSEMFIFIGINCFMLLFSYLFIYIIEKVWGFTSNVMLVELGDLNSPLLKSLSEKCPGTFQHATQVANLAAEAANAIGANALLVRTGALYHDIGKSTNPIFFTENQHGVNPHNSLSYKESARIIISHVKEGLNLAKSHHIPESIKGFIATHHGISKAKYFYTMYKNEHPDEVIDEALFSYDGPKPRTKEEGILMIADIIEANSRSLKDFSGDTLTKIVNSTIDEIIAEGELSETPLTFRDVTEIRKALINRLQAIYHPRISYPESK